MFTEESISKISEHICLSAGLIGMIIALIFFYDTGFSYFIMSVTSSMILFLYISMHKNNQKKYLKKK